MLNLWVDDDGDYVEEELELYSWFGDEEFQSGIGYGSNSLEDEEEEDEEDHEGNYTTNSHYDRNQEGMALGQYKLHYSQDLDIST